MAKIFIEESTLTNIGDAIRKKEGSTELISPMDMGSRIEAIKDDSGSGSNKLPQVIDGTVTEITAEDLKGATSIKQYAFYACKSMVSARIPNIITINNNAFEKCILLNDIDLSNVVSIGAYAFKECDALITVNLPSLTNVTGSSAFTYCTKLESFNAPKLSSITQNLLSQNKKLKNVFLPNATILNLAAFMNCTAITILDFPKLSTIPGSSVFIGCKSLKSLILRNTEKIVTLSDDSLASTPISTSGTSTDVEYGTGYIYVPRAFLNSDDPTFDYRQKTNWSNYASQFRALEDYTVDGTTTGEIDPNKI